MKDRGEIKDDPGQKDQMSKEAEQKENEIDEFHHFIARTKLQNKILLKLTENLQQSETVEAKPEKDKQ
jgi:hypothetical protein